MVELNQKSNFLKVLVILILTIVTFTLLPKGFLVNSNLSREVGYEIKGEKNIGLEVRGLDAGTNKWIKVKSEYKEAGEYEKVQFNFENSQIKKINLIFKDNPGSIELKDIYLKVGNEKKFFSKRELRKMSGRNIEKKSYEERYLNLISTKKWFSLINYRYLNYDIGEKSIVGMTLLFALLFLFNCILLRDMDLVFFENLKNISFRNFYFYEELIKIIVSILIPLGIIIKENITNYTIQVLVLFFLIKVIKERKIRFTIEHIFFIVFIAALFIFGFKSHDGVVQGKKIIYVFLLYFLMTQMKYNSKYIKLTTVSFLCGFLYLIFKGLGEIKFWSIQYPSRISGEQPVSVYAILLGGLIILFITKLFIKDNNLVKKLIYLILITSGIVCVIASGSRGPLLFLGVSLILIFFIKNIKNIKLYICLLLTISLMVGVTLNVVDNSYTKRMISIGDISLTGANATRFVIWRDAIEAIKKNPFTGIGITEFHDYRNKNVADNYRNNLKIAREEVQTKKLELKKLSKGSAQYIEKNEELIKSLNEMRYYSRIVGDLERKGTHNIFLEILLSLGIIGLISYLGIITAIICKLFGKYKNIINEKNKKIILAILGIFVFVHLVGLTDNTIYMRTPMDIAYYLAAIGLNIVE